MSKISSKNIKRLSVPQSPVVLAILDGWGYRKEKSDNAIKSASTPIMDSLWHACISRDYVPMEEFIVISIIY